MSEQTSQEPTMEEILASIRRIISEDEAPAEAAAEPAAEEPAPPAVAQAEPELAPAEPEPIADIEAFAPEPEPEPVAAAPAPLEDEDEDDLELTQKVETHGDLDFLGPVAVAEPEPIPAAAPLVSDITAAAAASAFGQLSASIGMPRSDRTLEDVVRELLRPLLQQWLDNNLPGIVQEAVQAEVERIARGRVR